MRTPLLLSLLTLGACASPLPQPDAGKAWVDLYATAGYTLMAHRLDDQRWPDGRYFQVAPARISWMCASSSKWPAVAAVTSSTANRCR